MVKDSAYPYERYVEYFKIVWPGMHPMDEYEWYVRHGRTARARTIKILVRQIPDHQRKAPFLKERVTW
jgi:hypothetical protein